MAKQIDNVNCYEPEGQFKFLGIFVIIGFITCVLYGSLWVSWQFVDDPHSMTVIEYYFYERRLHWKAFMFIAGLCLAACIMIVQRSGKNISSD